MFYCMFYFTCDRSFNNDDDDGERRRFRGLMQFMQTIILWLEIPQSRLSTVELSRVGGVKAPVGSRDPVYNFLCCWADSDDKIASLLKKLSISIKIHVYSQTDMESCLVTFQIVDRIRRQSSWAS